MPHTGGNFYSFDTISFSGGAVSYPANTFAGMKIYSATLTQGFGGSPTKLTVRCVQDGDLPQTSFPRAVGGLSTNVSDRFFRVSLGSVVIPQLYLEKWEKSSSVSQKTLTLNFVDGSILLDKIFVGLTNTHACNNDQELLDPVPSGPMSYTDLVDLLNATRESGKISGTGSSITTNRPARKTDPTFFAGVSIMTKIVAFDINLNCEPCYKAVASSITGWGVAGAGQLPSFTTRPASVVRLIDYGRIVTVDHRYGGKIIIGAEGFTQKASDIGNVEYNFSELLICLKLAGIDWRGFIDINPAYMKAYTGTLREVLDSWAADFGFQWYWDWGKSSTDAGVLRAFSLWSPRSPAEASIRALKKVVFNPPDGVGFDNISETEDMSETKNVVFQVHYKKPAMPRNYQRRIQTRNIYTVIDPYDLFPPSMNGHRNRWEFLTSCALAKFNKNARTLYNVFNTNAIANGTVEHLGIRILATIDGTEVEKILNADFSCDEWSDMLETWSKGPPGGPGSKNATTHGYIAAYSRQEEQKWESWEAQVAGMIGKYYLHEDTNDYLNFCGNTEKWESETVYQPQGQLIKGGDFGDLPFASVVKSHPAGRSMFAKASGSFNQNIYNINSVAEKSYTVFSRSATWGTDSSQFDSAFVHSGVDYLEKLVPSYITLAGKTKTRFISRCKEALTNQAQAALIEELVNTHNKDVQIILLLAPPKDHLANVWWMSDSFDPPHLSDTIWSATNFQMSNKGGWNNPNEYKEKDLRDVVKSCKETFYEKDITKDGCRCPVQSGWSITGHTMGMVPIVSEEPDEPVLESLAPRNGNFLSAAEAAGSSRGWVAGGKAVMPWADWGYRIYDPSLTPAHYSSDQHYMIRPFMRDEKQIENYQKYGTTGWYLAEDFEWVSGRLRYPSKESRYLIHLCQGFRINSYLPGYTANLGPGANSVAPLTNPFSASPLAGQRYYNPTGSGYQGPPVSVDIIFPSQNWYQGVKNRQATVMRTEGAQKQVRGPNPGFPWSAQHSRSIEVNNMDITNDFQGLSNPEGNSVVQLAIPIGVPVDPSYGFSMHSIDSYYLSLNAQLKNVTVSRPRQTLSFRQIGADPLLAAGGFLNPAAGLDGWTLTLDQGGSYIDWSFSTRPATLPKPEPFTRKVGPAINQNAYR